MGKPRVCFVATNKLSCEKVGQQLKDYLGEFIEVDTWYIRGESSKTLESDIFIAGSPPVFQQILGLVPEGKKVLLANRTLEIANLDAVLTLAPGTEALMVSSWEQTASDKIELLRNFGIDKLKLYPYWQGCKQYPKHVRLAITTGGHLVPPDIEQVIDVGVRTLDLSTFVELIVILDLPREVINEISGHYISAIIQIATRRLIVADQSEKLKRRLEAVLATVDQGIIAIDKDGNIVLFNPTAEKMLDLRSDTALGRNVRDIIPEADSYLTATADSLVENIRRVGSNYYIINSTSIIDLTNEASGVVISMKAANQVQELDSKVRRELKRKGNIARYYFNDIISESPKMISVINMAKRFSNTDLTVLLEGPSGTGKELFAQSIHTASIRKNAPFIAVNFAALPDNLVESELFGYEEGAFTGARRGGKAGLFEEAHTGTIFLDEIGDASPEVQKRLLRVLEEKEVRRVGGNTVTPVDVRVIAATNQILRQLVEEGRFRQDLYFRLCTIQIEIPPLTERRKDIPTLISFFANRLYRRELSLDNQVHEYLVNYDWPGNVRELQNVVKFLCGMVEPCETTGLKNLPSYLVKAPNHVKMRNFERKTSKEVAAVVTEFSRLDALEALGWLLQEFKCAAIFGRQIGRQAIVEALANRPIACPEHKVRSWLKRLEKGGCIVTGVTKQGSRITRLGEEVLTFLETDKVDVLARIE